MKSIILTATIATLALSGAAFAKAHDQGMSSDRERGTSNEGGARNVIDALTELGALDGNGVSAIVKDGQQGAAKGKGQGGK